MGGGGRLAEGVGRTNSKCSLASKMDCFNWYRGKSDHKQHPLSTFPLSFKCPSVESLGEVTIPPRGKVSGTAC